MSSKETEKNGSRSRPTNQTPTKSHSDPLEINNLDRIIAAAVFILTFLIYLQTMSRSVSYIDGGEITTDLWTLGIAHPTGYPLFTLLGYLFTHIPIVPEVAERANLMAAVCTSAASSLFFLVFMRAQQVLAMRAGGPGSKTLRDKKKKNLDIDPENYDAVRWSSLAGALTLSFSGTFWYQSTSTESYSLELVLFAVILFAWLGYYAAPTGGRAFFAGLALGLGFANHMTTVLTVPALMFLLFLNYREKKLTPRLLWPVVAGGLTASLLYLYLPIRASQHPLMDWGNPDTLKRFIWHVTGKQFRTWMFSSFDVFQHQLGVFFGSLLIEYRIAIVAVIVGTIVSFISRGRLFWWTAILFVSDVAYAANYSIHNIASYFLLAYISLALLAAVGFRFILERLPSPKGLKLSAAAMLIVFPGISCAANFPRVNERDDYAVESYTKDILTSLPRNSLVLSFQWDDFVAASIYYQHVDNVRPDVIVIDKELLRRSWYIEQVHRRYAYLFPGDDQIYLAYRENLRLFENGLPYDANSIEHTYSDFIREIISGAMRSGRDVFVGPEIENQYLYGYDRVPYGLMFRLTTDTAYVAADTTGLNGFRAALKIHNDYTAQILRFYTTMFLARAQYEYSRHYLRRTLGWIDKSLEVDPALQSAQTAKANVIRELGRQ